MFRSSHATDRFAFEVPACQYKVLPFGLAFEGRAYQYKVLPFELSLSPPVFMKVGEGALVRLREQGVHILISMNGSY